MTYDEGHLLRKLQDSLKENPNPDILKKVPDLSAAPNTSDISTDPDPTRDSADDFEKGELSAADDRIISSLATHPVVQKALSQLTGEKSDADLPQTSALSDHVSLPVVAVEGSSSERIELNEDELEPRLIIDDGAVETSSYVEHVAKDEIATLNESEHFPTNFPR